MKNKVGKIISVQFLGGIARLRKTTIVALCRPKHVEQLTH